MHDKYWVVALFLLLTCIALTITIPITGWPVRYTILHLRINYCIDPFGTKVVCCSNRGFVHLLSEEFHIYPWPKP